MRYSPRIEPPCPFTVAIEEDRGAVVAYGVVADISKRGGCIRTDVLLEVGTTVHLRLSFDYPPEIHTLVGTVAWARSDSKHPEENAYCCGLEWLGIGYSLRGLLRQLTNSAAPPPPNKDQQIFENRWIVAGQWPPPILVVPAPPWHPHGNRSGVETGPATLPPIPRSPLVTAGDRPRRRL